MRRKLVAGGLGLVLGLGLLPAWAAGNSTFTIVSACNSRQFFPVSAIGQAQGFGTVDTFGNFCVGGASGGGGAASQTASNGADAQAPSTTNQQAVSWLYVYNGTGWDRLRGTGGAANVAVSNFPATQAVTWTNQTVAATQSGTWAVSISNFPATQPVSGTVTANQGAAGASPWPTTDSNAAQTITSAGTAPAKSQGVQSSGGQLLSLDASTQAVKTTLGSPFQAGGSIANTGFNALQGGAANAAGNPFFTQVTNFPATQAISAASLPLPSGAATAANQNSTAAGTSATSAQGVQGVTGGVPLPSNWTQLAGVTLGSPTAWGTAPTGNVIGVNAYVLGGVAQMAYYTGTLDTVTSGPQFLRLDIRGQPKTSETGSSDPLVGIVANGGAGSTCNSAAAQTGCVAKNIAGNFYRGYATATTAPAAQQYLVCINATAVPSAGATIAAVDFAPFNLATTAASTASINFGPGPPSGYTTGIVCLISTSLTTYTAGTAAFINISVR